jgi:hypothetical protein
MYIMANLGTVYCKLYSVVKGETYYDESGETDGISHTYYGKIKADMNCSTCPDYYISSDDLSGCVEKKCPKDQAV